MLKTAAPFQMLDDAEKILLVGFVKTTDGWTVDVQNANDAAAEMKRNHDFGIGRAVAGDMPGELMYIIYALNFVAFCRSTAYAAPQRNSDAGGQATEWPQHQSTLVHQIESTPVDVRQCLI